MTGSSVFDYVHREDHVEVAEQLGLGLSSSTSSSAPHSSSSGLASPCSGASEEHGSSSTANPDGIYSKRYICIIQLTNNQLCLHSTIFLKDWLQEILD